MYFYLNIDTNDEYEFLWTYLSSRNLIEKQMFANIKKPLLEITEEELDYIESRIWVIHLDKGLAVNESDDSLETMPLYEAITTYCFSVKMLLKRYGLMHIYDDRNISSGYGYPL